MSTFRHLLVLTSRKVACSKVCRAFSGPQWSGRSNKGALSQIGGRELDAHRNEKTKLRPVLADCSHIDLVDVIAAEHLVKIMLTPSLSLLQIKYIIIRPARPVQKGPIIYYLLQSVVLGTS